MIRVTIKHDQTIPEGYKYIDCNHYTPEEFIRACSPAIRGCINQNAVDYVRDNPQATYDTEDLYRVRSMPPAIRGAQTKKREKNPHHWSVERHDPVQIGDMSVREMADRCGVGVGVLEHCMRLLGMPYRWGMNPKARRKTKYLRPSEVLQFMEKLPKPTEQHMMVIRRLKQDSEEMKS